MGYIKSMKLHYILVLILLVFVISKLIQNEQKTYIKIKKEEWHNKSKLKFFGEQFQKQHIFQYFARYDSGYTFELANGTRAISVPIENKYQVNKRNSKFNDLKDLDSLLKALDMNFTTYHFWVKSLEELDAYEISKVAFPWCENTLIIDYRKAPFFDAPAKGWFYFPNNKSCVNHNHGTNENKYFHSIIKLNEDWYYAIEK